MNVVYGLFQYFLFYFGFLCDIFAEFAIERSVLEGHFEGKLDNFRAQGNVVKTDDELRRMGEKGRFRDGRKRDFSRKRPFSPMRRSSSSVFTTLPCARKSQRFTM